MEISLVVSSYNRDDKVLETLNRLFESDLEGIERVEVLVIDDGSPRPLKTALQRVNDVPSKFDLKLLTQANRGIGATRNRGFRVAAHDIIIFLDDDILVRPCTLKEFAEAQRSGPGPVIFGSCPFISHESESLARFIRQLNDYDRITREPEYEKVDAMISGAIAVNRAKLSGIEDLYRDDMTIPAAEEFEAIARFNRLGIPLYRARHIHAIHNHHAELEWLVQQQYKYGMGIAEAFCKCPSIAEIKTFEVVRSKLDSIGTGGLKNYVKRLLSTAASRLIWLKAASALEKASPSGDYNFIFGLLTSAYLWAGYREGIRKFKPTVRPPEKV